MYLKVIPIFLVQLNKPPCFLGRAGVLVQVGLHSICLPITQTEIISYILISCSLQALTDKSHNKHVANL